MSAARRSQRSRGRRRWRGAWSGPSRCSGGSAPSPARVGRLRTYDAGHARALALMRRGLFAESYGPSIAAGEAIAGAGRPDLAYGCWANAAGAATAAGEPDRALEFLDRGARGRRRLGAREPRGHLLAERSFVLRRSTSAGGA